MTDIKVVIGANYGDEGKGLMTDYFCSKAKDEQKSCIVVCSNGGSQRGHTVETPDGGIRHVFHHFGSGTLVGADTYLSEEYIVNPMIFVQEYKELIELLGYEPKVFINTKCKISTPFDMISNQIIEESRGKQKHGSCGVGIWETIVRYNHGDEFKLSFGNRDFGDIHRTVSMIKDVWFPNELMANGVPFISDEWKSIVTEKNLITHFIHDFLFMKTKCVLVDSDDLLKNYDCVVFENGQGLLLDQNIIENNEHTTPSNTGLENPAKIIKSVFQGNAKVEVCYVSRSYLTRHGAGPFPEECDKSLIGLEIEDETNVPNKHQGTIRYGNFSYNGFDNMILRCYADFANKKIDNSTFSIALTHYNEYKVDYKYIHNVKYISSGKTRKDIIEFSRNDSIEKAAEDTIKNYYGCGPIRKMQYSTYFTNEQVCKIQEMINYILNKGKS